MDAPDTRSEARRQAWDALRSALAAQRSGPALRPLPREGALRASFAQQRLWLLEQLAPGSAVHSLSVAHALRGALDLRALQQALTELLRRHEALRTTLHLEAGELLQRVHPPEPLVLVAEDLRGLDEAARASELQRRTQEAACAPFELERGPLLRVRLLQLAQEEHRLLVSVHHAAFDAWSFDVFMAELGALYGALRAGRPSPLPEPTLQYADVAAWQRARLQGPLLQRLRDYWVRQLQGPLPRLRLPSDHARAPQPVRRGASHTRVLPRDLAQRLEALSQREGVTLFTTLLAAFQALLHRYTGEEDLVVGTPVAGRAQAGLAGLVGLFVNTLPVRTRLSGALSFRELLARVREAVAGAWEHQELPFELLVEAVNPPRQAGQTPLFQVMFAFQNVPRSGWSLPGLEVESWPLDSGCVGHELTLFMELTAAGLKARLEYDADLFEAPAMAALLGHLHALLEGACAAPELPLWALPLMGEEEQRRELAAGLGAQGGGAQDASLCALFEEQVRLRPGAVALAWAEGSLSYAELERRSRALAHHLRALGVGPGARVGVRLERSPALVVALLAILRAGGAYVPVDPSAPAAYASGLLREAGVTVLLAQDAAAGALAGPGVRVLPPEPPAGGPGAPLPAQPAPEAPAYVLFTSGSTGSPRGVVVSHRAVAARVKDVDYARLGPGEVLLQLAPVAFDASTFELWGALLNGATLALAPPGPFSLEALAEALRRHCVSVLFLTSGLFELFVDLQPGALASVRQLLVGGDVLSVPHARRFLAQARGCALVNVYGPTENTTFTTFHPVDEASLQGGAPVPIGRPLPRTQVHVLDAHLRPVPRGVEGEAWLGGDGVALGYLGDEALTRARFVEDPFQRGRGLRLYRSGDRVRRRADGTLQFLGRVDAQVKLRGFRVEPGEVEAALARCPGVAQAAVGVQGEGAAERRLVAYVVPGPCAPDAAQALPAALRTRLRGLLPEHLVPSAFVLCEALPLTPSGKVDRRALPAPGGPLPDPEAAAAAPRGALEQQLAALFEELLQVRPVGLHDDFFDLGGHSLLAVRLARRIEALGLGTLPLARVVQQPTVARLAEALRSLEPRPRPGSCLVELARGGSAPPLFLVPGGHGGMAELSLYARVLGGLAAQRPLYGLLARGLDGRAPPHASCEEMARDYLEALRAVQPEGPYALAGECVGGAVAFEMARQLAQRGERVSHLVLLSSSCPSAAALRHHTWVERPRDLLRDRVALARTAALDLRAVLTGRLRAWWRAEGEAEQRAEAKALVRGLLHAARGWARRLATVGEPAPGQCAAAERNYTRVLLRYRPRPYPGPVTLLADAQSLRAGLARQWERWAQGGLRVHAVPGTHESYLREHGAATLQCLRATLAEPGPQPPRDTGVRT